MILSDRCYKRALEHRCKNTARSNSKVEIAKACRDAVCPTDPFAIAETQGPTYGLVSHAMNKGAEGLFTGLDAKLAMTMEQQRAGKGADKEAVDKDAAAAVKSVGVEPKTLRTVFGIGIGIMVVLAVMKPR